MPTAIERYDDRAVSVSYGVELLQQVGAATVGALVRELVRFVVVNGIATSEVVVKAIEENRVRVAYYREVTRNMIEDVIPVEALYAAHASGQAWINGHLDGELRDEALDELARRRRRRLST